MTIDKIRRHVDTHIIDTINTLVNTQDTTTLAQWLNDCEKEIAFRQSHNLEGIYSLQCEKAYLQMVIN